MSDKPGVDDWCFDMSLAPKSKTTPSHLGHDVTGIYLMLYCPDESLRDPQACICIGWWEPYMPDAMNDPRGRWQGEADYALRPIAWRYLPLAPAARNLP